MVWELLRGPTRTPFGALAPGYQPGRSAMHRRSIEDLRLQVEMLLMVSYV